MSYDLRIYTVKNLGLTCLQNLPNAEENENYFMLRYKNYDITVWKETPIEEEDIPQHICKEIPGLKYLIEFNLSPISSDEKKIKEALRIAKIVAKENIGVIENPQTNEINLPSGLKRVSKIEKTERFSIIEMSWWFNHKSILEGYNLSKLLETIERFMPEALPRRYGLYEPPKEVFSDIESFKSYLLIDSSHSIVWYPSKPVDYVNFGVPEFIGPTWQGYRFGHFSVSIDAAVLEMPGWITTIERCFNAISLVLNPFYGDIYILKNHIRSRTVSYHDIQTESHPISSWWWNGIPKELGVGVLIGEPLLKYVKIEKPTFLLDNHCQVLLSPKLSEQLSEGIEIDSDILQPINAPDEYDKKYPKAWPFEGTKVDR